MKGADPVGLVDHGENLAFVLRARWRCSVVQCFRLLRKRLTRVAGEIREQGQKHFRADNSIQIKGDSAGGHGGHRRGCKKGRANKVRLA